MSSIKLAGNYITGIGIAYFGHLQIVNATTGEEIEVQSWTNPGPVTRVMSYTLNIDKCSHMLRTRMMFRGPPGPTRTTMQALTSM